jgi:hypothetical protein
MMSTLDSVLAQYEKAQQSGTSGGNRMSMDERMKKYFAAILPQGQNSAQKRIRILPTKDGSSPFVEAWFHEVQVGGQWNKLYDPSKNDNERSPLNEVYEELISTGKESDKELAKQYKSRKFYIVKVIDRDKPEDGVKFWRFKHNYKNEGVLDKIIPIWRAKGDITDPEKGRDLIIELAKAKTPKGKDYTIIQTVMYDDPTPVHEEKGTMDSWINDELSWRDVYSKKPEDYLEAIARGETPRWDSDAGKYVYGDSSTSEMSMGGGTSVSSSYVDPQANSEPDDDMPF